MPSSPQKPAFKSYALLTGLVWAGTIIVVLALNCWSIPVVFPGQPPDSQKLCV